MRSLILFAAFSALAWARPETYKENEEFQYSRSSSDEGSKSGYYGAQRGNMAGNYEKAHNMDSLAQHQMSGAINQVEGELGDASNTRTGSVYTAANTRGVYGSGHYDLSNLQGRNFGDSSSSGSHSSMSSAYNQHSNSDWRSQAHSQQGASSQLGQSSLHLGSLHAADGAAHGSNYGTNSQSRSSGYHSASGYQSQSGYDSQNNYDGSSLSGQSGGYTVDQPRRYTIVAPVRIVGRPGSQVAIPVYGQAGYDAHRASSSYDQSSSNRYASQTAASSFDQNAINSEAEVLNNNQQHVGSVPATNGKHYSSSYNYHKAWERNSETTDTPVTVAPVANPLSVNSELYEDAQGANAYNSANRYNSYSKGSSQSSHQSDYRSQQSSQLAQTDANSNAYTQGAYGSHSGLASIVDTQPKSYQSSYSYHKSWEKQGDPYVIVPGTNGEASQRIVAANTKNTAASQRHGSHQHYSQGGAVDCDSLCRYRRATRSADYYQQDLGQQAQTGWDQSLSQQTQDNFQRQSAKLEDLGQQTQDLEDLGQQTQQSWGNLQQQSQSGKLEDLGQQTQQSWGNLQQQSQSGKLEDLGQQTQHSWGSLQQSQSGKLEDLGQQTQQSWGNLQQQSQSGKLEELGQQTQHSWGNLQQQSQSGKLEDLGQQTQQSWGNLQQSQSGHLEDFGQQTQGKWHELNQNLENNREDLGQQTQQSWNNIEQQASHRQNLDNLGQQTQGQWDNTASDSQQSQQNFENLDNLGQQTQQTWDGLSNLEQQNTQQSDAVGQQTHNMWHNLDDLGQQVQTQWDNLNTVNKTRHTDTNTDQQTQTQFGISVHEVKPNREHAGGSTENNPDNLAFWGLTNEQRHENNHYHIYHNQDGYNNYNSYSNSQAHGVNWGQHINNNNAQTTHNNPLQSIWDKLDNMEEQSEHSSNENQQHTEYQNSQHSFGQESSYHHDSNWERSNSTYNWNQQETYYSGNQQPKTFNTTVDKPNKDQVPKEMIPEKHLPKEVTTEKPKDDDDDETLVEFEPAEVGRGDIGADGDSKTTPKTILDSQTYTTHTKPEKSPEEIEALSLSRGTEEYTTESDSLSVLSISQQKLLEDERQRAAEELHISSSKSSTTTSTATPQSIVNKKTTPSYVQVEKEESQEHDKQQSGDVHKNDYNFQQETVQQNQDFDQQNQQEFSNFGNHQQNIDQQDLQQFQNVGQHNQNFDQQNQNVDQQNAGQQLQDFGQQTQDLDQQNLQQFTNLGQQSQNFDQQNTQKQFVDFGQQTQDLAQQNLQQSHNLGQHTQNDDQQNTEQQFEDFGQQSQNLDQQNLQQFTDLERHSHTSYQQAREYSSHSNTQIVQEPTITPARDHGSESHPKEEVEIVPPTVSTTEKPGFWRSVGNKLTNAKDSVASWFRS